MRRAVILLLLFFGVRLILPLGVEGARSSQTLLTFGFLILGAYTVGELASGLRLPKMVGYLAAGMALGPSALGIVTGQIANDLSPVSDLAVALIAFLAGAELRWAEVRQRGAVILKMLGAELGLAFAGLFVFLLLARELIPFLQGSSLPQQLALIALFTSVAVVHSPAVTLALLSETGARGAVARTTLGIVLVADVAVIVLFSGALALARSIAAPPGGGSGPTLGSVSWEIGGSVLVGAALGACVALYLRFVQRELLIFGVMVAFFGAELARIAHVEALLTLLVAGFVTENALPRDGEKLRHAIERSAAPIFVVFFALAGAKVALGDLATLWPLVVPIVIVRALGIWGGTRLGARWARAEPSVHRYTWMGLVSQAGVAIGLATIVAESYPERGAQMRAIFLAMIAVNETLGPILFRRALARAGELASDDAAPEPGRRAVVAAAFTVLGETP